MPNSEALLYLIGSLQWSALGWVLGYYLVLMTTYRGHL